MEVEVAEWSKALDSGSSPKGRGFKSRPLHFLICSLGHYLEAHSKTHAPIAQLG
jgi:hypothetical protein